MTMRLVRSALAALLLAAAATMFAPSPAFACSCDTASTRELVGHADVVVRGSFGERSAPLFWLRPGGEGPDPVTYPIDVEWVYRGDVGREIEILTPEYGASCGLEDIDHQVRYVVFASYETIMGEPTDELWAILCGGTAPATDDLVAEVEAVLGPGSPPSEAVSHQVDDPLAGPAALASGGVLLVLTGVLWLRFHRR